ncbi:superoxide dismutase family protein [Planococcus sp. FY231025]|uniref:superoxide dismutase family protein n=1 Tax=Planococcus sp. FY231025 TaxID=3455699 RepID=UPI003F92B57A
MKKWLLLVFVLGFLLMLAACGNTEEEPPTDADGVTEVEDEEVDEDSEPAPEGEEAEDNAGEGSSEELMFVTVEMMDSDGNANGTAELEDEEGAVAVKLDLEGLDEGTYKVQFHDEGKCEAPEFETVGEPLGSELPEVEASGEGTVSEELAAEGVTLKAGEENSLLQEGGTALVVHDSEDAVVACGVVTAQQ